MFFHQVYTGLDKGEGEEHNNTYILWLIITLHRTKSNNNKPSMRWWWELSKGSKFTKVLLIIYHQNFMNNQLKPFTHTAFFFRLLLKKTVFGGHSLRNYICGRSQPHDSNIDSKSWFSQFEKKLNINLLSSERLMLIWLNKVHFSVPTVHVPSR